MNYIKEKNENDLVSREALKEAFRNNCFHNCYYCKLAKWDKKGACYICGLIDNAPTVELQMGRMVNGVIIPIERPQGECCGSCYLCDVGDCKADLQEGGAE